MVRLAIVVPSLVTGGAENMAAQLAAAIDKNRFYVELLVMSSPKGTNIEKTVKDAGVKTVYFNKELGFSIKTLWEVYKYLNQFKPDVIHTHLSGFVYAIPWALLHGVTLLHTIHNRPIYEARGNIRRVLKFLYKKRRAIPVAISSTIAKETVALYNISSNMVETIFNPVDVARFARYKKRTHENQVVFVNVARFSPQKNQTGLVEAFSCVNNELPNARLVFIGDGELKKDVEKKVEQLGLKDKVNFTGNVADIPQRLARADVFVLPSHYEGLPMSILEAMAAGLPCIASKIRGNTELIEDGKGGFLFEPTDIDGFAEAINTLSENENLRKKMGVNNLETIKNFDIENIKNEMKTIYYEILGSNQNSNCFL
ncbi:MAG: glycosyltransferase family 4 protein [Tissierellia bacterium]|nr:glycosyltransferase family 4 protein [Tissierellia bacterium]